MSYIGNTLEKKLECSVSIFCKHDWKILSDETTESKLEHTAKVMPDLAEIRGSMCNPERKKIQILTCEKCGKLKRFVTKL